MQSFEYLYIFNFHVENLFLPLFFLLLIKTFHFILHVGCSPPSLVLDMYVQHIKINLTYMRKVFSYAQCTSPCTGKFKEGTCLEND